MRILKIKQWIQKKSQAPQFDVIHKAQDGTILAVRRIKDRYVFDLGYKYPDAFRGDGYFMITGFNSNLINVIAKLSGTSAGLLQIDSIVMQGREFSYFER